MVTPQPPGAGRDEQEAARERTTRSDVVAREQDAAEVAGPGPADVGGTGTPVIPEQQEADSHAAAVAELEDRWRRALADLDNLRKRSARELERERAAERALVAAAFLPVLDNLDLALEHAGAEPDPVVAGVQAVRDQAVEVLTRLGFPRHEEVGVPFDPARHEVVSVVDDPDAGPGTVVRVIRPGYGEGERQLRPMAAAVARARE
jgi:molecular chaperone GrpE